MDKVRNANKRIPDDEWYEKRKKWLEEKAEEMRSMPEKADCSVLMDYLDEYDDIGYIYKPAIMMDECRKGYIPDIMISFSWGDKAVVDFVNKYSPYYSKEYQKEKAKDITDEGYYYFAFKQGILTGNNKIQVTELMCKLFREIEST